MIRVNVSAIWATYRSRPVTWCLQCYTQQTLYSECKNTCKAAAKFIFYSSRARGVYDISVRSMNYEHWRPTNDRRPTSWVGMRSVVGRSSLKSHILGQFQMAITLQHVIRSPSSLVLGGFSETADRTAPFPVGSDPRWRPTAILKNLKRPYVRNALSNSLYVARRPYFALWLYCDGWGIIV